jgi:hypothetical protein
MAAALVVPQIAGSLPAEAVGFFRRKNPQHAILRNGSKAVCLMSQICGMLKNRGSRSYRLNYSDTILAQFHLSLLGALALLGTWRHLAAKVRKSKGRGKQWQTTPKNLPRMQRDRAIPVSGFCQTGPRAEY